MYLIALPNIVVEWRISSYSLCPALGQLAEVLEPEICFDPTLLGHTAHIASRPGNNQFTTNEFPMLSQVDQLA